MNYTAKEVLTFVKENDVKFVRLGFCDMMGIQKNIAIMADQLPSAFENGVSFDASAVSGYKDVSQSDLLLLPDPSTLMLMPWRPDPGSVVKLYCNIKNPDGSVFEGDGRQILKRAIARGEEMGLGVRIGTECEFYLFKTNENGDPTHAPFDQGGYMDIAPLDKGENMRREICLALEQMGLHPEASHHEQGPGQNEVDFESADALVAADHLLTFKACVKSIAARNGLFASFMPKPIMDKSGSGLHVNLSLWQNGQNITLDNALGNSFIAGVLDHTPEMTLFLNAIPNSYPRLGLLEAPKYVSWSHQNRSQLIRIPAAKGDKARFELRSPDPAINPYLAFALILSAGLDGIARQLPLPSPQDADMYTLSGEALNALTPLPKDIQAAAAICQGSAFVKGVLGEEMHKRFVDRAVQSAAWPLEHFFHLI